MTKENKFLMILVYVSDIRLFGFFRLIKKEISLYYKYIHNFINRTGKWRLFISSFF